MGAITTNRGLRRFLMYLPALPAGIALTYLTPLLGEAVALGWASTTLVYVLSAWLVFLGVLSPVSFLPERTQWLAYTFVLLVFAFVAFSAVERVVFPGHGSTASDPHGAQTELWSA
jgi:hypothetical protein